MITASVNELSILCERIISELPTGGVVILRGDLASGKTTLTQAFARFIGMDEIVTSPTFSLQQRYGDKLYHYDLYNYGYDKFMSLGMMEELEREGFHLIEWGDDSLISLLKRSGIATLVINISKIEENKRSYEVNNV